MAGFQATIHGRFWVTAEVTALILQHVYPSHFAMCSHFLASQLHIRGDDSPEFYLKYCIELKAWSDRKWPTKGKLTVVEAEYGLWTWYRTAYKGETSALRRKAKREFLHDPWIRAQRQIQIADSLNLDRRLDLARAYANIEPTVAAIIAWREYEIALRSVVRSSGVEDTGEVGKSLRVSELIQQLPNENIPPRWSKNSLKAIWSDGLIRRNDVMHEDHSINSPQVALRIVNGVETFITHNCPWSSDVNR